MAHNPHSGVKELDFLILTPPPRAVFVVTIVELHVEYLLEVTDTKNMDKKLNAL